ncbi:diphthamide biosynthesis protein 3 [Corchorus olitorius]|uniref:Diphthamide biosynthesis protein 3 n=1 Tax=Corchorus olitorius TaxID=93759 RepID=A0A1R3HU71_9ROSI|nr:diphthamide biosynthesis protein 3 [Corchorus olitorius]
MAGGSKVTCKFRAMVLSILNIDDPWYDSCKCGKRFIAKEDEKIANKDGKGCTSCDDSVPMIKG